jgi:CheY-like chemotaxis protein
MSTHEDKEPKRIVLMEDNPSDIFLLRRALDEHGVTYRLETVSDGERAFELVSDIGAGKERAPDLMILDLNLPRHDGIEVLQKCRSLDALRGVPCMILTSSDSPRERDRAESLGVNAFVHKPIMLDDFMELGAHVRKLLEGASVAS